MIRPKSKDGEWRFRNNKWYKAEIKKEWVVYITKKCPECGVDFLTRHDNQTCSKKCRAKFYWRTLSLDKRWKTKRMHTEHGYVYVRNETGKIIVEHRYLMEKLLKRKLTKEEHVHHINGDRQDNRLSNLIVIGRSGHNIIHKPDQTKNWSRNSKGQWTEF